MEGDVAQELATLDGVEYFLKSDKACQFNNRIVVCIAFTSVCTDHYRSRTS